MWRLVRQEPWECLVQGTRERLEVILRDVAAREQCEGRTVRRALSFVTGLAMLVLPRNERPPSFRHVEDRTTEFLPRGTTVGFLDAVQRRALGIGEPRKVAAHVLIPAPGRPLDPRRGEFAELRT